MGLRLRQDHSQKGGHRWRIFAFPIQILTRTGAIRAKAEVTPQALSIRDIAGAVLVSAGVLTTIHTFVAPEDMFVAKIRISGELGCRVDFVVEAFTEEEEQMTNLRKVWFDFASFPLFSGQTVEMKIIHGWIGKTPRYRSTIYGYPQG